MAEAKKPTTPTPAPKPKPEPYLTFQLANTLVTSY